MKFLRKFWECLESFLPNKRLSPSAPLTRYIFSIKHFDASKNTVSHAAFMPLPPPRRLETSVSQIRGLSEKKIWQDGEKVGNVSKRNLKARADFRVESVTSAGLIVKPDGWPRRHANLVGWPSPDKKSEQMRMANKLALEAKLKIPISL